MTSPAQTPLTIALVRDLLFASKITATASSLGTCVQLVRDPVKLDGQPGRRLIVDLNLEGAIEAAQAWKAATDGPTVGFGAEQGRDARTFRGGHCHGESFRPVSGSPVNNATSLRCTVQFRRFSGQQLR